MMDFAIMQKGELMTNREAVNWLINITADIGKAEHRDLWHYEQALYEIREMFEAQPETHDKRTETHVCDCISRQAAIDAIQKWGLIDGLSEGQAIEILADEEKVPSAQPETQWISCRAKEPAEELNCWFTANNCYGYRYVEKGMFTNRYGRQMEKGFITTFGHFVRWESVLAWMPIVMPEPWEGENDG